MRRHIFALVSIVAMLPCLSGCPIADVAGGLKASDFTRISENGWDAADNAQDHNDYAWAMEYFVPDTPIKNGAGHVYVASGNNMVGLMIGGMMAIMGGGTLDDIEVFPPEIRRYRPDLGAKTWERVLDIRDDEAPDFETIGFRHMKVYRAQSDGVNYLYAATFGREAKLWRTATGEPGSWTEVWQSGDVGSIRWMEVHGGWLYLALANDAPEGEQIAKIYATDGASFWPIVEDGFGNPDNTGAMSLISYNDWLYCGTQNSKSGYEIWKLEPIPPKTVGPSAGADPIRVVAYGGCDPKNQSAITPCIFKDMLYYGAQIYHMDSIMGGFKGADVIRIYPDDRWEPVVGPGGLSGMGSGFDHWANTYIWCMCVHDGWMYAGTFDQVSSLTSLPEHIPAILANIINSLKRNPTFLDIIHTAGADLYKTQDGVTWHPVTCTGFDDVGNYGFRTLVSAGDDLYLGTANPFDGLEIWKASSSE